MKDNYGIVDVSSRRKLLSLLIAGSGIAASGRVLPTLWTTPLVEAVVLPAHAQASYRIICEANPPSGNTINSTDLIDIVVTVLPNPGPGQPITVSTFCADFVGVGGGATDGNGQLIISNSTSPSQCPQSAELRHTFTFMGQTAECSWDVNLVGGN